MGDASTPDTGSTLDGGGVEDLGPVDLPFVPASVETVAPAQVQIGQPLKVSCLLVDSDGEMNAPPPNLRTEIRISPEGSVAREGDQIVAIRTGQLEVACAFPTLALTDGTPALVEVIAGPPATVETELDTTQVTAGGTVTATCTVYDAFGNVVEDSGVGVTVDPLETGNTADGNTITFTRAGRYTVTCRLEGAASTGVQVEVLPGLPAQILVSRIPDEPVYFVRQIVLVTHTVLDQYGNVIPDARVVKTSSGAPATIEQIGDSRFRYNAEGTYTVTATVQGKTEGGVPLSASVDILVNSLGPQIRCESPGDGTALDLTPGLNVRFRGSVADALGIGSVTVNGQAATVLPDGSFEVDLPTRFGINFVDIVATDSGGVENSRTCAFLVANQFVSEGALLRDAVMLRLAQSAVDDGSRAGAINSLNDILQTVINSQGLRDTLHNALSAANPLKPDSCDQRFLGVCVLSSRVDYISSSLPGPNTSSLTLVSGGVRASVRFEDPRIRLRVRGRAAGIPYDTTGNVDVDFVELTLIFDTGIDSAGRPSMSIRSGTVTVNVGTIRTSFSGIDGFIVNLIVSLANGTVRNILANTLRDFVSANFNAVLDGLVSNLDISTLGATFNVPRLSGSGSIPLNFGVSFTTLATNGTRMLFGIGTRFSANAAHDREPRRVVLPPGEVFIDPPSGGRPVTIAVHAGLLNQALHTLWRAGLFDATLPLGEGASAAVVANLPPVARIVSGSTVGLDLGALNVRLTHPALFPQGLPVVLGARASTTVSLVGNDLSFGQVNINELFFSTEQSLDQTTRDTVENFLRRLIQSLVDSALNDSLPALPIPGFAIPSSLGTFGLPVGSELGITSPSLVVDDPHFLLRGNFGIR